MSAKSIQKTLKSAFPKTDNEEWKNVAAAEINDPDPLNKLSWRIDDDLLFLPIYNKVDVSELQYLQKFNITPSTHLFTEPNHWNNLPNVVIVDEEDANKRALNHLENGADGILFELNNIIDFSKLFSSIEWSYCTVVFELASDKQLASQLKKFILTEKYDSETLSGALFWKSIPDEIEEIVAQFATEKKIKSLGLVITSSTPVNEIADALIKAVELIDSLIAKGVQKKVIVNNIAFSITAENNFFINVAKIKALRMLWYQITQAYNISDYIFSDLHLHLRATVRTDTRYEPNSNMLAGTLASLSSVIGGCSSLTVYTEDKDNPMLERIARNISTILREESHLGKVSDPAAGSYAVECITHELAGKAWEKFLSRL